MTSVKRQLTFVQAVYREQIMGHIQIYLQRF